MANPTFGERGVTYCNRYGVYAVIPDAKPRKDYPRPSSKWCMVLTWWGD